MTRAEERTVLEPPLRPVGLAVIDIDGAVQWSYVALPAVTPGADGILAAREGISAGAPTLYGAIA